METNKTCSPYFALQWTFQSYYCNVLRIDSKAKFSCIKVKNVSREKSLPGRPIRIKTEKAWEILSPKFRMLQGHLSMRFIKRWQGLSPSDRKCAFKVGRAPQLSGSELCQNDRNVQALFFNIDFQKNSNSRRKKLNILEVLPALIFRFFPK